MEVKVQLCYEGCHIMLNEYGDGHWFTYTKSYFIVYTLSFLFAMASETMGVENTTDLNGLSIT